MSSRVQSVPPSIDLPPQLGGSALPIEPTEFEHVVQRTVTNQPGPTRVAAIVV